MTTHWFSLRRRLLGLLLGGVALAWVITLTFSYVDAHHEVDELFDAQLAQAAQTLLALASHEEGEDIEDMGETAHKYQRRLRFQIWDESGRLLLRSENAPETALTAQAGFSDSRDDGGRWRHFSQWNRERTLNVQVSEDHRIREELSGNIAWRLLLPALFGLPLIGFWVWFATRHGMATLDRVAREIACRDPQQLDALQPDQAPEEVRTLISAINDLFLRVETALSAERRFTADAAHELRTPLAALQAQLQVALRARDDAERQHSLVALQSGLARAARLVDQMLLLARLDPASGLPDSDTVDLAKLAESVCAELGMPILERKLDFDLQTQGSTQVLGHADWLGVLMRNLIDNAIRYTPSGGKLRVSLESDAESVRFIVTDSGPGIPVTEREAVLQRFHRLDSSATPGNGLGLAIVSRIVELHRADLTLTDAPDAPGLQVVVRWPAPIKTVANPD